MAYNYSGEGEIYNTGLFEFESVFTVDESDLNSVASGSGVHLNRAVEIDLGILDRSSGDVSTQPDFLDNSYVQKIDVDILDITGGVKYSDFLVDYKSNFLAFTEYDNFKVFGDYAKHFGVKIKLEDRNSGVHTSEFYFYGNEPIISGIAVQDSTGTTSHTGSLSSKTAVNSTGQTGALTTTVTFLNDTNYISFDRLDIYYTDTSDFDLNLNPQPAFSRNLTNNNTQSFDLNEGDLPNGEAVYLHYVPYGNLGSGDSWSVGPYTFADNPITDENFLTTDDTGIFLTGVTSGDITGALGYTPLSSETDDQTLDEVLTQGNTSQSGITVGSSTISGDLDVSGALTVTNDDTGVSDIFSVDGVNGRLFGVTDEVTGTIFSVNDAAGLPILEVESTSTYDKITIGEYGTDALVISGTNSAIFNVDVDITGGLDVTGDITMGGETVLTGITSSDVTDALGYTPVDVNDTGDFVTSSETGSFLTAHPSIAAASSSDNSARTYIQDVLLDSFGHVTGLNTSSESTDPNYYLTGVSKAGNVFTFEVDGATNPTYTLTSGDITGALGFSPISTETDSQDLDSVLGYGNSSELGIIVGDISGTSLDITTDVTVTGDVEADEFIGDLRGAVSFRAKAGEALSAGEVVYISGIDGNTTVVAKADANDPNKMPAFGVSKETVNANANVRVVNFGSITNLDTSNYSEGDELFVSDIAGQLTGIAPTGEASALQKMAKVTRSDNSAGSITVMGAGRSNAVPNLNEGRLFVGNSSNEAVADGTVFVDIANSRVGIGTTDPSAQLTISKNSSSTYTSSDAGTTTGDLVLQNNNQTVNNFNRISFQTPSANSGGNILDAARITAIYSDHGGANPSAHLSFETKEDAGTMYERMRIDSDGNVGIGTTSPSRKFEVHEGNVYLKVGAQSGFADVYGPILTTNSNSIVAPERVYLAASQAYIRRENIGGQGLTLHGDTFSRFTYYNGSGTVEALRIDNAGNVGIGTTTPRSSLDIGDSDLYIGNHPTTRKIYFGGTANYFTRGAIHTTQTNLGLYNDYATGYITLNTNSGEAVRVDEDGNVGIGTTSPSAPLDISSSATGGTTIELDNTSTGGRNWTLYSSGAGNSFGAGKFALYDADAASVRMLVDTSGNVGIGTTSPDNRLEVVGPYAATPLKVLRHGDYGNVIQIGRNGVSETANIGYPADSTINFSTAGSERVRINSSGNVGIGTTSPSNALEISNASFADQLRVLRPQNTEGGIAGIINIAGFNSASVVKDYARIGVIIDDNTNATEDGSLVLQTITNGTNTEKVRINASGNVGIGTTSPAEKLHVGGDIRVGNGGSSEYNHVNFTRAGGSNVGAIGWHSDNNFYVGGHPSYGPTAGNIVRVYGFGSDIRLGDNTNGDVLTVDATNGNVGIGDTTPSYKLDVAGDIRATGDLRADDDIFIAGNTLRFTNDAASAYIQSVDTLYIEADSNINDTGGKPIIFRAAGTTKMTIAGDGDVTIDNDLIVSGDLTVNGTTTTINSTTVQVDDKNIELGSVASPTDTTADGGGITLKGATDKTINWVNSTSSWTSNQTFSAPNLTLTNLSTYSGSDITALMISGGNIVGKRALGTAAFSATSDFATASHNHTLDSLSNTTITSNTSGEILKWNGSAWINNTLAEAGIAAAGDENIIDGATSIWNADGDGDVFTYNDSNPTHNSKGTGAVIYIRGDGSNDGGLVRAGIFTSDHVSTANGYYVGTLLGTTNSTTTQVINNSGEWTGAVISSAKLDADTAHLSGTQTFSGAKTFSSASKFASLWSSSTIESNSFYVQNSTDGFAFGVGTSISTWFSWDNNAGLKRAIDVWNDGSKILLGNGGHDVEVSNDLLVSQYISHTGDTDTFIRFQPNDVNLTAAGQNLLRVDGNSTQKTVVVNEVGIDADFRVESSGEANALFVRGSDGNVGIGTTNPAAKLHVYNSAGGDATDKAGMLSEAVMKLQPHASNSTNMLFAQVNSGNGIGIQVTNGPATANWDIALSPFGGNVGIGTISPNYKLTVEDIIGIKRSGVAAITTLQQTGTGLILNAPSGYHPLVIKHNNTELVRFKNDGNVGIGT